jgi:hypothetical protein
MAFSISTWLRRTRFDARVRLSGQPMEHRRVVNPHHAVGIAPGPVCCKAAAGLKNRRFLSAEAPKIPLADCDSRVCQCRYVHFEDRRQGDDRRQLQVDARGHSVQERRRSRGNRTND